MLNAPGSGSFCIQLGLQAHVLKHVHCTCPRDVRVIARDGRACHKPVEAILHCAKEKSQGVDYLAISAIAINIDIHVSGETTRLHPAEQQIADVQITTNGTPKRPHTWFDE